MSVTKSDGKFKLTDAFSENDGASQTQKMIPWGIPIEYTVIPVLNSKDKYSGGKLTSDSIESSHNFTYTNTASIAKKGSTIGYGLNLRATKAEFSNKIELEWDAPYGRSTATPVFYRKLSSTSEYKLENSDIELDDSETKAIFNCKGGALIDTHEFAVKYGSDGPLASSFIEKLHTDLEDNSTEQRNKGYAFALGRFNDYNDVVGLTASKNDSFTEIVSWPSWDYAKKANGPEDIDGKPAYTIWEKNLNNASGWFMIGSMDAAGNITITNPNWYETEIKSSYNQLTLKPKVKDGKDAEGNDKYKDITDSSGCSNGLLKVQRDYKHYYMIRAQRKVGDETIYTYFGKDGSVFGCRKISAEEFSKCITLILADAINQSGVHSGGDKYCGTFRISHPSATREITYGTDGKTYKHKFYDSPGARKSLLESGFTIIIPNATSKGGADGNAAYYFPSTSISVNHESNFPSYNGTLNFTAGKEGGSFIGIYGVSKEWSLSVGTLTCSDNETEFKEIFPFGLGQDHKEGFTTYKENYPTYQGNWWHFLCDVDNEGKPKVDTDGKPIETDTYKETSSFKEKEGE